MVYKQHLFPTVKEAGSPAQGASIFPVSREHFSVFIDDIFLLCPHMGTGIDYVPHRLPWEASWLEPKFRAIDCRRNQPLDLSSPIILPPPAAAAAAKSLQLCPTLCDPIDGSPPGSPVPGILQARTLEWAAISFSNA